MQYPIPLVLMLARVAPDLSVVGLVPLWKV